MKGHFSWCLKSDEEKLANYTANYEESNESKSREFEALLESSE